MRAVPVREIHEIELSSVCNLACAYCPHPTMQRPKEHMPTRVFERVLEHLSHLCAAGTQGEVSLTGIGEAILHPQFAQMAADVRRVVGPDREIILATNGVAMTQQIAYVCRDLEIGVYVSLHRPEVAAPARDMLLRSGVRTGTNHAFVDSALDWAGQVRWHVSAPKAVCKYLTAGWAVIRQDGSVDACCLDASDRYPIGHVNDAPGTLMNHVTPLCATCHLAVPESLREAA